MFKQLSERVREYEVKVLWVDVEALTDVHHIYGLNLTLDCLANSVQPVKDATVRLNGREKKPA